MKRKAIAVILSIILGLSIGGGVAVADSPHDSVNIPVEDPVLRPTDNVPGGLAIQRMDGKLYIRLNNGNHQAHLNIIVRGASITDVYDDSRGSIGLEDPIIPSSDDPYDGILEGDGLYGGCSDDVQIDFGSSQNAKAQLYTCGIHDAFYLVLDYSETPGLEPAVKFIFTERNNNTEKKVWISNTSETYKANEWIPLTE